MDSRRTRHIAIVGSGAAGLSAAWLLSRRHRVTLLEREDRLGGHAHTASVQASDGSQLGIDTGFIVFNEPCYPNLTRWFEHLGVETQASDMSFSVSRDNGNFEYAGGPALGLLAQPGLLLRPGYWRMLADLVRFYRQAMQEFPSDERLSLGDYLQQHRYSQVFIDDHLLPFGSAIWSTPRQQMLQYPAASFIRFCDNHGLLNLGARPQWRTVRGGSRQYVDAVVRALGSESIETGFRVAQIERAVNQVSIRAQDGRLVHADDVVLATHADQALACLSDASDQEKALLGAFGYEDNQAFLHSDIRHLPRRRRAWCSWNHVESTVSDDRKVSLSYWMNRLQGIRDGDTQYIVTLNPGVAPDPDRVLRSELYRHPVFNADTWQAQQQLWSLQGQRRTWFCGSYFGAGFHEDAVQAGLAVAEQLGGEARPWSLQDPSSRIVVDESAGATRQVAA